MDDIPSESISGKSIDGAKVPAIYRLIGGKLDGEVVEFPSSLTISPGDYCVFNCKTKHERLMNSAIFVDVWRAVEKDETHHVTYQATEDGLLIHAQ